MKAFFGLIVSILLPRWCKISRPYLVPVPVPSYWTWTLTPLEKSVFSGQIFIKLKSGNCFYRMLELPTFGQMATSTVKFQSCNKILLMTSNSFILRRRRVAVFAEIIKIVTMFTKTIWKDPKKVKRIRNYA